MNHTSKGKFQKGNKLGGRPKMAEPFRDRARKAVDDFVIDAWVAEVQAMGENWIKASELLAAYGYGKPSQPVTGADGQGPVQVQLSRVIVLPAKDAE